MWAVAQHVFISYSHSADKAYADRLAAFLAGAGFDVWYDAAIVAGGHWADVIQERIESCAAFVVVMTTQASTSTWVSREITHAEQHRKPIFPLLLEGKGFFVLGHLQHEDVTGGKLPSQGFVTQLRAAMPAAAGPLTPLAAAKARSPEKPPAEQLLDVALGTSAQPPAEKPGEASWWADLTYDLKGSMTCVTVARIMLTHETHLITVGFTLYKDVLAADGITVKATVMGTLAGTHHVTFSDRDKRHAATVEITQDGFAYQITGITVAGQELDLRGFRDPIRA